MNYNIKGTGISVTPEIREYVEKKLGTLDKFLEHKDAARADVEVQYLAGEARMYRAELMLLGPGLREPLRAEARGHQLHEAIDIAAGELSRELTQFKKKKLHMFRRSAVKVKEFIRGWREKF